MTKFWIKTAFVAFPMLLASAQFAAANVVCTTSGGDSRTFTETGRDQTEAQTKAFNLCNGAGSTGKKSCQRNMNCAPANQGHGRPDHGRPDYGRPDHGRPDYGRPDYGRPDHGRPDFGRPDYGRPGFGRPGFGRPHRQPIWQCVTHSNDSRRFYGSHPDQNESRSQAFNACNSAGSTGRRSCERNLECNFN